MHTPLLMMLTMVYNYKPLFDHRGFGFGHGFFEDYEVDVLRMDAIARADEIPQKRVGLLFGLVVGLIEPHYR